LDAVLKRVELAPFFIETHQRFEILVVDGTPIGSPRQRRENLPGADRLLVRIRGPAGHDLAHAGGVGWTLGKGWARNPWEAKNRVILQLRNAVVVERLSFVFLDNIETRPIVRLKERDTHRVRTGFDGYGNVDGPIVLSRHSLTESHTNVIDQFHPLT